MKTTSLLLLLVLALPLFSRADEKALAAQLEAKGMKLRKDDAGGMTEISISSTVIMTREDGLRLPRSAPHAALD